MSTLTETPGQVRVRFAPSPTGFLHIGGVRTALFNWLYARHNCGKFLLRIEDTDLERSEERYTHDIINSMNWLGLTWDEEPVYQAKRLDVYMQKAEELIAKGHAYKCYCTQAEVDSMREAALDAGKKPMYDRRCRDRKEAGAAGAPFVIRAKIPQTGRVEFTDLIRGVVSFDNTELDDFVLIRSNGAPTYNLSVVVDDVFSKMTHIIRGDDHINNTPKQIHLYSFFGYQVPKFAHLPMILGPDKKKLSKRHGAVSANAYRAEGFMPEVMLNFLARLGWSHGDQEVFTVEELIKYFSFDHVQKSSAVFNSEKLLWLNGEHIRRAAPERLLNIVAEDFSHYFSASGSLDRAKTALGVKLASFIQQKIKLVKEMAEQLVPLCTPGVVEVDASGLKWNKDPAIKTSIKAATRKLVERCSDRIKEKTKSSRSGAELVWGDAPSLEEVGINHVEIDGILRQVCEQFGLKLGDFAQPMRLTVTGRMVSAGLFELLVTLPWDLVKVRLEKIESL